MNIQQFNFSVDLLKVILWHYNDAEKLQTLLTQKQDWYTINQTEFWQNWYKDVFDLRTANEFGLAVWAIILDIPLIAQSKPSDNDSPAFGFGEYYQNFENGDFFATTSSNINLTTEQRRIILQLRYFQLVSKGTVPEINQLLHILFGDAFVLDAYDMNYATFVFNDDVSSSIKFILENFDLLPRPAGVGVSIIYRRKDLFGFEKNYTNFENGVLADYNDYRGTYE